MFTYGLDVGNAGKKPHQRKRGKKSKRAESFVTEHVDRLQSTADVQQPVKLKIIRRNGHHEVSGGSVNPFSLVFLSDHPRVTTCTGCSRRFARMADGGLFPPLDDIVTTHREGRPFRQILHTYFSPVPTHFPAQDHYENYLHILDMDFFEQCLNKF